MLSLEQEARLRIRLLGHFEVWRNGTLIHTKEWGRRKTQSLLKLLLTEQGQPFSTDQLLDALYANGNPHKASVNLRTRISQLRRVLEPDLTRGSDSQYILHPSPGTYAFSDRASCWVDIEEFEEQGENAPKLEEAGSLSQTVACYRRAIELYRGDFLAEDIYEEWTMAPRARFRELYFSLLERCAECYARLGQYSYAIEYLRRLLALHPVQESAYRRLMEYYYRAGDRTRALQTYTACVQALREHLEVEPSNETVRRYEEIQKGEIAPTVKAIPHHLPWTLTSFIGREQEIAEIKQLLHTTPLLTLTGIGGCGKTCLALKVSSDLLPDFQDGVCFVELDSLTEPEAVPQAVASALRINGSTDLSMTHRLISELRGKQFLLVLDNCEHLVEQCARLVATLIRNCPKLRILATSREGLGVSEEILWLVPPLSMPNSLPDPEQLLEYDAIRLFREQGRAVQPSFTISEVNFRMVAQICRRLDGIPLAIALAAARLQSMSIEQIAARLDDRFQLLTSGNRTALPRHQTLRAALDWSFHLLLEPEQVLLRRLSVFFGGFTLDMAETICSGESIEQQDVLNLVTHLVEKSLLLTPIEGKGGRYRMLETVRMYAKDKLLESGEVNTWQRRHRDFFLRWVEEPKSVVSGNHHPREPLARLQQEHHNLRAALKWSLHMAEQEEALQITKALVKLWDSHSDSMEEYVDSITA